MASLKASTTCAPVCPQYGGYLLNDMQYGGNDTRTEWEGGMTPGQNGRGVTVGQNGKGDITPEKYGSGMTAHEFKGCSSHINYS